MSEITPEAVADFIADSIDAARAEEGRIGAHSEDCVLHIEVKPTGGDVEHFRAVVVPGETVPALTETARLKARLESAEYTMRLALAEVEHEEVVHLLNRYFAAAEAEQERTQ
jgi:hypothetical protein